MNRNIRNRSLAFVFLFIFTFSAVFSQVVSAQPQQQAPTIQAPTSPEDRDLERKKQGIVKFLLNLSPDEIRKLFDFLVVQQEILAHYVDNKSSVEVLELAMTGMVEGLDQYSHLFIGDRAKAIYREFTEENNYVGTGMVLTSYSKQIYVAEVIDNSPAARAGIEPGDSILSVNGKNVYGLSTSEVSGLIRGTGDAKTPVVLEIKNQRLQKPKSVTIFKQRIVVESVTSKNVGKDIVYAKIRTFMPEDKVVDEFREVMKKAAGKKLIIDLRDNGGGSLAAVTKMVGFIIGPDQLVVTLKGKEGVSTVVTPVDYNPTLPPSKIVVLVNNFSASASEIMAGTLQHYKKAQIVGIRTFGKATAQHYLGMDKPNHSMEGSLLIMGLTTGRYYLPDGKSITGNGVQPDVEVEQPELFRRYEYGTKRDYQLKEAIKLLKRK